MTFYVTLAVVLGITAVVALQFHAVDSVAGFLLLPFLGYTTFGALLLSFSLHSGSTEVRSVIRCGQTDLVNMQHSNTGSPAANGVLLNENQVIRRPVVHVHVPYLF